MKDDELDFDPGDIITVTGPGVHKGWWCGELNGKTGLIPTNYIQIQQDSGEDESMLQSNFIKRLYKSKKPVSYSYYLTY